MREVKILKHLPWLVLFLILTTGTTLWWLFVCERQDHLRAEFSNQLERVADELFRGRLEGRLGPNELPEGILTFAIYDDQGRPAATWGQGALDRVDPSLDPFRQALVTGDSGDHIPSVGLIKVLQPLRPRMGLWMDTDRDGDDQKPRPAYGRGNQGFLYVRVASAALDGRINAWTLGGVAGTLAWTGFTVFIGWLWFRTRRYQAALTQNRELLQFAEASRTLGHELQNPLAAILLQTALLKRSAGGEVPGELQIIEEEARRISGLVSRVRDFLKDPKGQAERLDLGDLVTGLRERFALPVGVQRDDEGPYPVLFDAYRLRSVVENLLKNAVESGSDSAPEARLSRPKAGWVRLEVTDRGPGFTPEALRHAFDPFFTTKSTGTGIGLSIADSFVRAAGGRLKVENRPEGGAKVTLELPEAPAEETP